MYSPLEEDLKNSLSIRDAHRPPLHSAPSVEMKLRRRHSIRRAMTITASFTALTIGLGAVHVIAGAQPRSALRADVHSGDMATSHPAVQGESGGIRRRATNQASGGQIDAKTTPEPVTVEAHSWTELPSAVLRLSPETQQMLHHAQIIAGVECLKARGVKNVQARKPPLGANHLLVGEYFRPPLGPKANATASIAGPKAEERTKALAQLYLGDNPDRATLNVWSSHFAPNPQGTSRSGPSCQEVADLALFRDAMARDDFKEVSMRLRGFASLPGAPEGISAAWRVIRFPLTECMESAKVLDRSVIKGGSESAYNSYIQSDPKRRSQDVQCKKDLGLYSKYYTVVATYETRQAEKFSADVTTYTSLLATQIQQARSIIKEHSNG